MLTDKLTLVDWDKYEVREDGDIIIRQGTDQFLGKKLTTTLNHSGYPYVHMRMLDGKLKKHYVHRVIAYKFHENPENKPQINHIDGDKLNNHASNLEWATQSENIRHAHDTGLKHGRAGTKHHRSSLTETDVLDIRWLHAMGVTVRQLAEEYAYSRGSMWQIVTGRTWGHL